MTTTLKLQKSKVSNTIFKMFSVLMLAVLMMGGFSGNVYAAPTPAPTGGKLSISLDGSGTVNFDNVTNETNVWNALGNKLQDVIAGVTGVATITMVLFMMMNLVKVAAAGTNGKARADAWQGAFWTGIAALGLGSVTLWIALFYNTGKDMQKVDSIQPQAIYKQTYASVESHLEMPQFSIEG